MLKVSATTNLAGVTISGDHSDLETLYDSLPGSITAIPRISV